MKQISSWLKSKFSPRSAYVEADEAHTPLGVGPVEKFKEELSDSDHIRTLPLSTRPKESSYIVQESTAFDPYNSAILETSKSRSHD
jgi:hypothetical protein